MEKLLLFFYLLLLTNTSYSQGLELVPEDEYQSLKSPPIQSSSTSLPKRYVIPESHFPTPKSQGRQPSCVGWAVGYGFMSFYQAMKNDWTFESEEQVFSPSYVYHSIRPCNNCACGSRLDLALNLLRDEGVVPIPYFPYDQNSCKRPYPNLASKAGQFTIPDWYRIESINNLTEIKSYLSNHMPIIVSVKTDDAFHRYRDKRDSDTYVWPNSTDYGNHAMVIVGYDDNREAFKLLNSWGTYWGSNGYVWIDYRSFRAMSNHGYVVEKDYEVNKKPKPKPDPVNITKISRDYFKPYALRETIRENRYYFTFGFEIDERVRDRVTRVNYVYNDPSFISGGYCVSFNGPNFTNSYEGMSCARNIEATVHFKDGTSLPFSLNGCDLLRNTHNNVDLKSVDIQPVVTATPVNESGTYNFRVQLRGIESVKDKVVKVTYDRNHSSFSQRYVTTHNRSNNFEGGYRGWGCLRNFGVTIFFNDNTSKTFTINMCEKLGW